MTGRVNIVGGPNTPNGASNCWNTESGALARGGRATPERPDSPCSTSTVEHIPAVIAAAACRTWMRNEQPPTLVPSYQDGVTPR